MKRSIWTVALTFVVAAMVTSAALATPRVTKRVVGDADGSSVVVLRVTATDGAIYGINVTDASGSIKSIAAPKGWVGIATSDGAMFRTGETPIQNGKTVSFRVHTTNADGNLKVSFRDETSAMGSPKDL